MKKLLILIFVSLFLRIFLSTKIYSGDLNNHIGWGESILFSGPRNAYERQYFGILKPTYPPLALYAFTTSYAAHHYTDSLLRFLNIHISAFPSRLIWAWEDQDVLPAFQKVIAIAADIGIGVLIFAITRSTLASALYLFNPAVWYNSALWGQIDSLPVFWVILSCYFVYRHRPTLSSLFFAAALLSKQSSIIFLPVFLIYHFKTFSLSPTIKSLFIMAAVSYLAYLPFSSSPNVIWPFQVYLDRLRNGSGSDYISDHAFNLWALWTKLQKISDIHVANIAKILFAILSSGFIVKILQLRQVSLQKILSLMGLIQLVAFLVLTRMHERYLGPALPLILLGFWSNRKLLVIYFLLSVAHLANLYHQWWYPPLPFFQNLLLSWNTVVIIIFLIFFSSLVAGITYLYDQDKQSA